MQARPDQREGKPKKIKKHSKHLKFFLNIVKNVIEVFWTHYYNNVQKFWVLNKGEFMPTKHIDKLLWERIEQKTVDIVILQKKMVKDTDVLQCLIESALDNISDEELSELIKKNRKS